MQISPRVVAGAHAAYLVVTGLWPLVHRASFERVTGKKEDFWLVRTVGGLALATGLSLAVSVLHGKKNRDTVVLALSSGAVFAVADLRAALTESRVYLLDTLLQVGFAPAWVARW